MKTLMIVMMLASLCILPNLASADGEAEVREIQLLENANPASLRVKVRWTGKAGNAAEAGRELWIEVRKAQHGDQGLARMQSLLTSALLSGKTIYVDQQNGRPQIANGFKLFAQRQ